MSENTQPPTHSLSERTPRTPEEIERQQAFWRRKETYCLIALRKDGSKEPIATYNGSTALLEELSAIANILSEIGIGPVIGWGDFAMFYYGIPTLGVHEHLLVPDSLVERAHKALISAAYVDTKPRGVIDWDVFGIPYFEFTNPLSRHEFPTKIFIQGLSMGGPALANEDTSKFKNLAGIAIPPLQLLAWSFLHALSKANTRHLAHSLFIVWCGYTKTYGYTPLKDETMRDVEGIDETLATFWETLQWKYS